MKLRLFVAILNESLKFAIHNIRSNLLRTLLSLLGITIGVFCIISILTLIDSLEYTIRESIQKFGTNVVFVQKWPWGFESDYPFWKYMNRPEIKYSEMVQLQKTFEDADGIAFNMWFLNQKVTFDNNAVENMTVRAVSEDINEVTPIEIASGRFLSDHEFNSGAPVTVIGSELAKSLFGNGIEPVGKTVNLFGGRITILGVMKEQGNAIMGNNQDMVALLPMNYVRALGNYDQLAQLNPTIMVKGKDDVSIDRLEQELIGAMRSIRKLGPRQEENFAVNKITMLTSFLDDLFGKISMFGWVIAGFSVLIGGFGIANIMFVSVKERTPIIGIQKALGAKRYFLLVQFLGEAIILCILGGIIGLILIFILSSLLNLVLPFKLIFTIKNILIGIGISSVIGVLAGYIPARQAARLDPIEAIRFSL